MGKLLYLVSLSLALAAGSDVPCQNGGGTCQQDSNPCSGTYQSGLCSGGSDRRCCLPASGADSACTGMSGTCQQDSLSCGGHYQSGLCSGSASRRCCVHSSSSSSSSIDCSDFGNRRYSATGTAYFPDSSAMEGGYVDMRGSALHTLQDFLAGRASYVSVAMDNRAGIAYGTPLCIPEINRKYSRVVLFKVVDTGGAFYGRGYSRIDICVQDRQHSHDSTINGPLTLVFH